jgi:hypothetical protein
VQHEAADRRDERAAIDRAGKHRQRGSVCLVAEVGEPQFGGGLRAQRVGIEADAVGQRREALAQRRDLGTELRLRQVGQAHDVGIAHASRSYHGHGRVTTAASRIDPRAALTARRCRGSC